MSEIINTPTAEHSCDCISYNQPRSWQKTPNVELRVGDYGPASWFECDAAFADKIVLVDACIAPIVADMWRAGIWTLNSCCGHGDPTLRCVVLHDYDRMSAMRFLAERDPSIMVFAWENVATSPADYHAMKDLRVFNRVCCDLKFELGNDGQLDLVCSRTEEEAARAKVYMDGGEIR